MVAISLLDIPPEIQLQIVESTETTQVLKALSVTSRSLRSIAQSLLFEEFRIDPAKELRGSINDLLANPRICAAIRVFLLGGAHPNSKKPPHNDEEKLSLIQRLLPEMVGLRWVIIHRVHLSRTFMDAFIEVAAKIPLRVNLCWNIYPSCISSAPIKPLRIYHLCLNSASRPSLNFYRSVLRASATMLTALNVRVHGDGLMTLADIDLPLLHDVTLWITLEHELSRTSISAFIAAQKTIRKLKFRGKIRHLPPLPPNALPNLQELNAPPELINQLVPGRPLEAIEVSFSPVNRDWFGEEVARSTARIRKLQVHLNTKILDTRMMGRMVTILPSLERLRLSVFDDDLLTIVEILSSLKCLTHLHSSLYCRQNKKRVNHNVSSIATKLRKANSCFSSLEIWEAGVSRWKITVSVWGEGSGKFHDIERYVPSVSGPHWMER